MAGRSTRSLELIVSYWNHLWRVELVVVLCLVLYGLGLTGVLGLGAAALAPGPQDIEGAALSFALVLWFGALPSILLFAPAYALLRWRGWINLASAIVIGVLCGAVFLRAGSLAIYAISTGAIVAAGAHAILRRMRGAPTTRSSPDVWREDIGEA